ncbi:MAG: hypothetical protein HY684_07045 [Chloroflexi bacterium]|nr:hypothetical protein [Chloroflexota bacterium]
MTLPLTESQKQVVAMVRDFVRRDILPIAMEYEHAVRYNEKQERGRRELRR